LTQSGWQAVDQVGRVDVVSITCEYGDWKSTIEVGRDWQFTNFRQESELALGADCPREFNLCIQDGEHAPQKVCILFFQSYIFIMSPSILLKYK